MADGERRDARWWVKAVTPPIVVIAVKGLARRLGLLSAPAPAPTSADVHQEPPEWELVPGGWDPAAPGWNDGTVAQAYLAKWPEWVQALRGAGPLGVYHEARVGERIRRDDMASHNMLLSFAYVLARAAHGRDRLTVLDWGGGLGHYAVVAGAVLPEVALEWHVREVPSVSRAGESVSPEVTFHTDDTCLGRTYDLVLASSSLQYAQDWAGLLRRLGSATGGFLLVTRLPVALEAPSFVVLQRAYAYGYGTEYRGWVVSRQELLAEASAAGLELDRELLLDAWLSAANAPEDPIGHRGFLFRPGAAG